MSAHTFKLEISDHFGWQQAVELNKYVCILVVCILTVGQPVAMSSDLDSASTSSSEQHQHGNESKNTKATRALHAKQSLTSLKRSVSSLCSRVQEFGSAFT